MTNRSTRSVIAGLAVVLVLLGAGVWFFFLRSDAPPEVDLESATEQLTSTTEAVDEPTTTVDSSGIDGTWVVDNETGEFDFDSATGSFAGYRVDEELASIGSTEAVGRTGDVTGEMVIDGTTLSSASITVNLSDVQSDKPRRDNRVREALGTDSFPTATFELTEAVPLGTGANEGEEISVDVPGELTIHGVTNEVTVALDAQLVDGTAVVVGSIPVVLTDYDIDAPSAPMVLSVGEEATVEFQLLFTPQTAAETTSTTTTTSGATPSTGSESG